MLVQTVVDTKSWVNPNGNVNFPMLNQNGSGWNPNFNIASNERKSNWRWLVEQLFSFPRFSGGFV